MREGFHEWPRKEGLPGKVLSCVAGIMVEVWLEAGRWRTLRAWKDKLRQTESKLTTAVINMSMALCRLQSIFIYLALISKLETGWFDQMRSLRLRIFSTNTCYCSVVRYHEKVTGRKARGLQMEEIACKCQTFLSPLGIRAGARTQLHVLSFLSHRILKSFWL